MLITSATASSTSEISTSALKCNGSLASVNWFAIAEAIVYPGVNSDGPIVVGVFVWAFLVRGIIGNYAAVAGAIALAIIMIPIVARTVEEVLRLVPQSLREAGLALGAPRWRVVLSIVVPTARAGIATAVVLAVARAAGETAPLLLTALGNLFFSTDLLRPISALPIQIYQYAASPYDDWHTKAWGSSLVLVGVIAILSLALRLAIRRGAR